MTRKRLPGIQEADTELAEKLDRMIRETADALQDAADAVEEQWEELKRLVAEAKATDIHSVLGFKSWPAYVADAIGLNPSNIGQRFKCVEFLVSEGMSQRAIANMLGVGVATVNRTVAQLIHEGTLEEIAVSVGLDGRKRKHARQRPRTALTPELRWQKVYATLGEDIGTLAHRITQDAEMAAVASTELDHLCELRDDLNSTIKHLRKVKAIMAREQPKALKAKEG
jgi:DNA-binding Lrp family transcriptional regulator